MATPAEQQAVDLYVNPEDATGDQTPEDYLAIILEAVSRDAAPLSVTGVVQMAGAHLTNEEDVVRSRAVQLLAAILTELPALEVAAHALKHLGVFFRDRLSDFQSVGPCLDGLHALYAGHLACFTGVEARMVVEQMWDVLHVPSMAQNLRQRVFAFVELMVGAPSLREELRGMGEALVLGLKEAMWGEKDPRCLLSCLRGLSQCIACVDHAALEDEVVEDLYNVTACYFPIMFTPPPNDPFGITRADLKSALRAVFSGTPRMAPHVVPLLLEKLESTVDGAKIDALETLVVCLDGYGLEGVGEFLGVLGEAIWQEVVHCQDADVASAALLAVQHLTALVSRGMGGRIGVDGSGAGWVTFADPLLARCCRELSTAVDSLVGRAAGRILHAMCMASEAATSVVLERALAPLLDVYDASMGRGEALFGEAAAAAATADASGANAKAVAAGSPGVAADTATAEAVLSVVVALISTINPQVNFMSGQHTFQPHAEALITAFLRAIPEAKEETEGKAMEGESKEGQGASGVGGVAASTTRCAIEGLELLLIKPPSPLYSDDVVTSVLLRFSETANAASEAVVRDAALKVRICL